MQFEGCFGAGWKGLPDGRTGDVGAVCAVVSAERVLPVSDGIGCGDGEVSRVASVLLAPPADVVVPYRQTGDSELRRPLGRYGPIAPIQDGPRDAAQGVSLLPGNIRHGRLGDDFLDTAGLLSSGQSRRSHPQSG